MSEDIYNCLHMADNLEFGVMVLQKFWILHAPCNPARFYGD